MDCSHHHTDLGCGAALAFATDGGYPDESDAATVADLLDEHPDNWGRWGDDDQRGTLNLLGGDEATAGMRTVLDGPGETIERFTLQLPITGAPLPPPGESGPTDATGDPSFPGRGTARRHNRSDEVAYREGVHEVSPGGMKFSDDRFETPFYLHGTTHMDALGHAWYGDHLYNGVDVETTAERRRFDHALDGFDGEAVTETRGLGRHSIANAATAGVAGRGVLLDVGRWKGNDDRLNLGESVTYHDLRATADAQGVTVRDRDIVFVRTGSMARTRDPDASWSPTNEPGVTYSPELIEWLHDRDVTVVGADNVAFERIVQEIAGERYVLPLHGALLRNLGMPIVEMLWLEDLADACARDDVYDFFVTAAPLNVERASGAPINPVVLKSTG